VRQLLILRHAKSSWANSSLDDWHRPLNERGLRDAPRVGEWLRARSLVPDLILTSDAIRARTTAQAVAASAGYARELGIEPSLYLATPADIITVVNRVPDDTARSVMIVGHNPGLEDLIEQLTGEGRDLPTAALVHLELLTDSWRDLDVSGGATIVNAWQPKGVN
jgi:phosphohistidine phosphatase